MYLKKKCLYKGFFFGSFTSLVLNIDINVFFWFDVMFFFINIKEFFKVMSY